MHPPPLPRPSPPSRNVASALLYFFGCITLGLFGWSAKGQPAAATEYQVKAAFLFNFVKFVEWPSEAFGPENEFVVGVLGRTDPFGPALDQAFTGKTVQGRKFVVRRFTTAEEAGRAHIVFVSASERKRAPELLQALRNGHALTVSDFDGFAGHGGMINFIRQENKIRFEINVEAAKRAGLRIDSTLLHLARIVRAGES